VLSPALISQLPAGQVVVIKRGMFPMIGRAQMAWKRAEVKAAKREARWVRRTDAALRRIHQLHAVVRPRPPGSTPTYAPSWSRAGIVAAVAWIRHTFAAGWIRCCRAAKSTPPLRGTTSSPSSRTPRGTTLGAPTISGKCGVGAFRCRDQIRTFPEGDTVSNARKPSSFGSKAQPSAVGS
jgi:hypothetical protein